MFETFDTSGQYCTNSQIHERNAQFSNILEMSEDMEEAIRYLNEFRHR